MVESGLGEELTRKETEITKINLKVIMVIQVETMRA